MRIWWFFFNKVFVSLKWVFMVVFCLFCLLFCLGLWSLFVRILMFLLVIWLEYMVIVYRNLLICFWLGKLCLMFLMMWLSWILGMGILYFLEVLLYVVILVFYFFLSIIMCVRLVVFWRFWGFLFGWCVVRVILVFFLVCSWGFCVIGGLRGFLICIIMMVWLISRSRFGWLLILFKLFLMI